MNEVSEDVSSALDLEHLIEASFQARETLARDLQASFKDRETLERELQETTSTLKVGFEGIKVSFQARETLEAGQGLVPGEEPKPSGCYTTVSTQAQAVPRREWGDKH
eukprot:8764-Prorocentrum_minimum.AAC.6